MVIMLKWLPGLVYSFGIWVALRGSDPYLWPLHSQYMLNNFTGAQSEHDLCKWNVVLALSEKGGKDSEKKKTEACGGGGQHQNPGSRTEHPAAAHKQSQCWDMEDSVLLQSMTLYLETWALGLIVWPLLIHAGHTAGKTLLSG